MPTDVFRSMGVSFQEISFSIDDFQILECTSAGKTQDPVAIFQDLGVV